MTLQLLVAASMLPIAALVCLVCVIVVYRTLYVFGLLFWMGTVLMSLVFWSQAGASCLLKHGCLLYIHSLVVRVWILFARASPIVSPIRLNQMSHITHCNRFCES